MVLHLSPWDASASPSFTLVYLEVAHSWRLASETLDCPTGFQVGGRRGNGKHKWDTEEAQPLTSSSSGTRLRAPSATFTITLCSAA